MEDPTLAVPLSAFITVVILLIAFVLWYRTKRFIDRAAKARGVVIKIEQRSYRNRGTFSPVVRFQSADGKQVVFTDPESNYPPKYQVNDEADVLYDPRNPRNARAVKKVSDLYIWARIVGSVGGGLLATLGCMLAVFGILSSLLGQAR